jgi:hypothetical protein
MCAKANIPLAVQAQLSGMLMARTGEQGGKVGHRYWEITVTMLDDPTLPEVS